ncbi:MAG: cytochrome c5 family protein [Burkholderiaceae bacterium]
MSDEHEPFIKTPKQLITVIVLSFVVPIALIILLVMYVGGAKRDGAGSDGLTAEAIAQRIAPVANLEIIDASAPKQLASGEAVYTAQCAACHAAGVAGAPKFADAASWEARIGTGYDALLASVVNGKGAMAAQGGGQYSDLELGKAVVHMVNAAGGDMPEPTGDAAAAADQPAQTAEAAKADDTAKADEPAPAAEQVAQATESVTEAAKGLANAAGDAAKEMADKASDAADSAAEKASAAVSSGVAAGAAAITGVAEKVTEAVKPATSESSPAPVAKATPASYDLEEGKKLYNTICMACHLSGAAGAPKFGDKAAWAGRDEKGVEALAATVISGKGSMPARGGSGGTDEQIAAAVAYMLSELK